jgi:hypothetical protein
MGVPPDQPLEASGKPKVSSLKGPLTETLETAQRAVLIKHPAVTMVGMLHSDDDSRDL